MTKALFNLVLSKQQKKYWPAIMWLTDEFNYRQEGRTTLMALAFIRQAIEHRGMWIRVYDHYPNYQTHRLMLDTIHRLLPPELLEIAEFRLVDYSFKLK